MTQTITQRSILVVSLLLLTAITGLSPAAAQTGQAVQISAPETGGYPEITVYIDPTDRSGTPLQGLSRDQVTLSEDGIQRQLEEFQELQPGVQLVVALNISSGFAIQDINGRSRFDFIKEALLNWAAQPLAGPPDDLSLVANTGLEAAHLDGRAEWAAALEDYSPDPRESESNFNVLARAIELALDPVDQPGMKRVVLLFSAQPSTENYPAIDSLTAQAADNGVMIYTVLVSSPAFFETEGAARLADLSQQTGGISLTFSGEEPLADPGQLLQPLRSTYLLRYQSSIVTGGTHTLEVEITETPGMIVGQREFTLDVQPPNPIFIAPPRTITRYPAESDLPDGDQVDLEPDAVALPLLVEFPDGLPRDLEELILRVDGEIVSRVTAPPFDEISWDLEPYQSSTSHYLTLEAVDIMGLSKMSLATPVEIEIELPPQSLGSIIRRNIPAFLGLGLVLLVGFVLFLLVARGTIHPQEGTATARGIAGGQLTAGSIWNLITGKKKDPEKTVLPGIRPYRLIPISEVSQQLFPEPITVFQPEMALGSQMAEDAITIKHPSVISRHARITMREDGRYQIEDSGSAAGTWINYQQISDTKSQFLSDGDMIHIGEAAFRFQVIPDLQAGSASEEKTL